jgi:superfamily II DNA or RNA helicase
LPTCRLIIRDEVNVKLEGLDISLRKKLVNQFKFSDPRARYTPAVRLGRWDGKIAFFQMGGTSYINLLPEILTTVENAGYDVEVDDQRTYRTQFDFRAVDEVSYTDRTWPQGHPQAGTDIKLRDYQVEIINNFLNNPQCLQEIATGAGKCLSGDTMVTLDVDADSNFGAFLTSGALVGSEYKTTPNHTVTLPIGRLAEYLEEFESLKLEDNVEISTQDHGLSVSTPQGLSKVHYFIKKTDLPVLEFEFADGYKIKVAQGHIFSIDGKSVYARDLRVGDLLDHREGHAAICKITEAGTADCFDISIPDPHLYYDAAGLVHHNTLITAVLSHRCEPYGRSVVIVPSKSLVTQTESDYRNMGLDVGVYFGDRKEHGHLHTICTWQSLNNLVKGSKNGDVDVTMAEFLEGVVCVIVDEAHGAKGNELKNILTTAMAHIPIRWGLTGTIPKEDFEFYALRCSIGEVVNRISASELQDRGVLADCHINIRQMVEHGDYKTYQSELKYLLEDQDRMSFIASDISRIRGTGNTLVLVDRVSAGQSLASMIPDAVFVNGGTRGDVRQGHYAEVATSDDKVIVATYGVAAVGINIVRLHNLVLIEPGKSFIRVIQSIGRGLRKGLDKDRVEIYDFASTCKWSKKHLAARKKYYKEAQYEFSVTRVDWQQ